MRFRLSNCRAALLLLVLLVLAGCEEQTLYQGLTEQEANEMAALLQRSGIPATKQIAGKENLFSVTTDEDSFADAVQLLQANGLPRTKFQTLGDVFGEQGFISSSTAQRAKYIHGLSQEISHTISSIDGVLLARVHLSVPEKDPLSDGPPESSASVFVKHRRNIDLSIHVGQIKALVVNGLENLPYENVTVALFESSPDQRLVAKAPIKADKSESESGAKNMQMQMGSVYGLAIVFLGVLIMAGYSFWSRKTKKAQASSDSKSLVP